MFTNRLVSRGLAITILVLAVLVPYFAVVQPIVGQFRGGTETIERSRMLIAKFRRDGARRAELQSHLKLLQGDQTSHEGFINAPRSSLAGAKLQSLLNSLVQSNSGKLISTQVMLDRERRAQQRVTVRVEMRVKTAALQAILHRIEGSKPFLFVDNILIRSKEGRIVQDAAQRASGKADNRELNVRLDVYGYIQNVPGA